MKKCIRCNARVKPARFDVNVERGRTENHAISFKASIGGFKCENCGRRYFELDNGDVSEAQIIG